MTLSNEKIAPNLTTWQIKESLRESDKPSGIGQQNPQKSYFWKMANVKVPHQNGPSQQ